MCVHCGECPAIDENGCCGHCHWQIAEEIERGFQELCSYLTRQRKEQE